MLLAEALGREVKMTTAMLTAFKCNPRALDFYKSKLGYVLDYSSPELQEDMKGPHKYEILPEGSDFVFIK